MPFQPSLEYFVICSCIFYSSIHCWHFLLFDICDTAYFYVWWIYAVLQLTKVFLLLYLLFIRTFGKCLLCNAVRRLWNKSNDSCVPEALHSSHQSISCSSCINVCLLFILYIRLYIKTSNSLTWHILLIWKIGKWSDISVIKTPFNELFKFSRLFVNMLSISVAELAVILVGLTISGIKA